MAKDPAFLFYPGDWLGGTIGMTFEEKGAYMELLMMQFTRGHMSERMIYQTVGQLWVNLQDKFQKDREGLWYNERLDIEKEKRKKYVDSRKNNKNGLNQFTSNPQKKEGHMTSHMENEDVNKNDNKDLKGGVGENFENESQKKELVSALMIEFNFSEIRSPDKLRLLWQFANYLESGKGIDYFIQTFQSYKKWKEISGEKSHNFMGLIGTPAMNFENGGWDSDNWQYKIDNYKPQGKTNPVSRLEQAQRLYESTRKG